MFVMGDEVRRSQHGNNNAYCQDNEISWFDWALVSKHADLLRFVKLLINRRRIRDVDHEIQRQSLPESLGDVVKAWHGVKLNQPDWSPSSHCIAITGKVRSERVMAHIIFNAYWEPLDFELPVPEGPAEPWRRWIDTSLDPPCDICDWNEEPPVPGATYRAGPRSVVVLVAGTGTSSAVRVG
jgi:glycogen operon protein